VIGIVAAWSPTVPSVIGIRSSTLDSAKTHSGDQVAVPPPDRPLRYPVRRTEDIDVVAAAGQVLDVHSQVDGLARIIEKRNGDAPIIRAHGERRAHLS
jgi:hypothetical protein